MQSIESPSFVESLERSFQRQSAAGAVVALPSRPAVASFLGEERDFAAGLSSFQSGPQVVGFDGCGPIFEDPYGDCLDRAKESFHPHAGEPRFKGRWSIAAAVGGNCLRMVRPSVGGICPQRNGSAAVKSFSPKSRSRMLWFLNSINRDAVEPLQMWFVTLTYPREFSNDPVVWKNHLKAWRKRLERAWGHLPVVWKLEFQDRGAPHFHLCVLMPMDCVKGLECVGSHVENSRIIRHWIGGKLREFRGWCSRTWYEVVGSNDRRHLHAGTEVEPTASWHGVISYAGKYLAKATESPLFDEETGEVLGCGKFWGVWRRELFPRHFGSQEVSIKAWKYIWRTWCKYSERVLHRPQNRYRLPFDVRTFVPFDFVARCLDQFGDDLLPPHQRSDLGGLAAFGVNN